MRSGHDDTTGQFCGAQMERGTEHFGRFRRTVHSLRVGDKERGALPARSKAFGTDPERQPYKVVKSAVTTTQLAAEGGATLVIAALRRALGARPSQEPSVSFDS